MRKLLMILASLALVFGVGVVMETPASAHNFDDLSLYTCYTERTPGWNVIIHSHPVAMIPEAVDYGCLQTDGVRCQHYFATYWLNGATSRHDDSAWYIC